MANPLPLPVYTIWEIQRNHYWDVVFLFFHVYKIILNLYNIKQ